MDAEADERETLDWRGLVGLSETMGELGRLANSGRMHPVILLEGRKGYGKRHLALWLAARWLCSSTGEGKPCGSCGACREVLAGLHPDVLVLDHEADAIKTADIEAFQRHFDMLSAGGLRIGVIMNADRMTMEAYNRALKTLEEPADQARMILTTSRPLALPATILGRCLRWRVAQPPRDELLAWSRKQMQMAGLPEIDDASLEAMVARLGYSPGRVYRQIHNPDEQNHEVVADVRALLMATKPTDVTRAANDLARVHKVKIPEMIEAIEWELSAAYRQWFCNAQASELSRETLMAKIERRRTLRDIRRQAVMGKVVLNTQLVAESIGLTRWNEESS